ncbi:MAG: hypothetical protein H7062_20010 [Candidatus Saccharimonas sp.]|nr:hypothetical protein [Planctomycetaceae bacterium]
MSRATTTSCRVVLCLLCICLGLSDRVLGQVTRTPEEVRKLAVGKYKVREYWGNHLQLKSANLTSYAGNSAGFLIPDREAEMIQRDSKLILKGNSFGADIPLEIEGLRLSMKPLTVPGQPSINARIKYTTLTMIQSLDGSMLCGMSHFTNGGPAAGTQLGREYGNSPEGHAPQAHGIAAFYLVRSDGRREPYPQPRGTDGEIYRPKFQLGVSDPAGLAGAAPGNANVLLGSWLVANGFDVQANPKIQPLFKFSLAVTSAFTPPLINETTKFGRFVAADGTNDVVVTNPLGIECSLSMTNVGLAGKPLLRTAISCSLGEGVSVPSSCDLKTEIRTLVVNQETVHVYQNAPCYEYPSSLVMMLPARAALEKSKLKGFSSRFEELAFRRK